MSNYFECACENRKGLILNLKDEERRERASDFEGEHAILNSLRDNFGLSFSFNAENNRNESVNHEEWCAEGIALQLVCNAALLTNYENWYGFCVSPKIRRKCLLHALALSRSFEAEWVVFVPEQSGLAIDIMQGWGWQQILDELDKQFEKPQDKKMFEYFSSEEFIEAETDSGEDDCYFKLTVLEIEELLKA